MAIDQNYNPEQFDRLITEIEGRVNDFETGITDKDETIKSFASFILNVSKNVAIGELKNFLSEWADYIDSTAYVAVNARLASLSDSKF